MGQRRIKGRIIHHCRDDYGAISIADDGTTRYLYFGDVQQSCIRLDRPSLLLEEYSRAMMSALLFRDRPESILLIGLGGCSLLHFLLEAVPASVMHVAEIRKKVIDLAREFFLLPGEDDRLTVFNSAGEDFITGPEARGTYDLILLDAFDETGPAAGLMEPDFLGACSGRLGRSGILVMNLWRRPKDEFPSRHDHLKRTLGPTVLRLQPGEANWNALVFWSPDPGLFRDLPSYRSAARELQRRHAINFPAHLMRLHRQNSGPGW